MAKKNKDKEKPTKTITTSYGTRIDVSGLTPEQIKHVRSVAQDKGAYGAKGAALADTLRKKNEAKGVTVTPGGNDAGGESAAGGSETADTPIVNKNGTINEEPFLDGINLPDLSAIQSDVDKSRDAAYKYLTQYNAQDKSQEIEAAKQELVNQGIPWSDDPNSRYQKQLALIERKYQGLDDQAKNQAIAAGNSIYQTESTAALTSSDIFVKAVLGMSDADLKKLGITKDYQAKLKAIAASNKPSGGGSSGSSNDGTPIIGGPASGFDL